jgi:hypothetical protein
MPKSTAARLKRYVVDFTRLPPHYPTQGHAPAFWEALGRTVATYGFLEEALGKAIFAFTGTREIPEEQAQAVYEKWLPKLEKALSDALGALIDSYGKAVRSNSSATITNLDELLTDLRQTAAIRNVLCHGAYLRISHSSPSILFRPFPQPRFRMGLLDSLMPLFCSSQPHRPDQGLATMADRNDRSVAERPSRCDPVTPPREPRFVSRPSGWCHRASGEGSRRTTFATSPTSA